MKVAVECQSPLLQKSLELFLANYLSSLKQCDIVVRDIECLNDERCFYISSGEDSDLKKPFSKSQLILALENRYKEIGKEKSDTESIKEDVYNEYASLDFSILEKRIDSLTQEYNENIIKAVRVFYEE